jgi:hypothetical protein
MRIQSSIVLSFTLLMSCGGLSTGQSAQGISVCGDVMHAGAANDFLVGSAVIVARQQQQGLDTTQVAVGFALGLVLNGIDFSALGSGRPAFVNDEYVFENGDAKIGLRLSFAEDVGPYTKGQAITHDLLDIKAFIRDVDVDVSSRGASYNFEPGPLFELIDGDVSIEGRDPRTLKFSLALKPHLISVEIVTEQSYGLTPPRDQDVFVQHLDTLPVRLSDLKALTEGEGWGLEFTDSSYDSKYYELQQTFTKAPFRLIKVGTDAWSIEGNYEATLLKKSMSIYLRGAASTTDGNTTDYYCDESRSIFMGQAVHDEDLRGGVYTAQDGSTFEYGLRDLL